MSLSKKALNLVSIPGRTAALAKHYLGSREPPSGQHVIIVHGLFNPIPWISQALLILTIIKHLNANVHVLKLRGGGRGPIKNHVEHLRDEITKIRSSYGAEKVSLVGHSLGAVVVLHYANMEGAHEHIEVAVLIGGPLEGTLSASFLGKVFPAAFRFVPSLREMQYKSPEALALLQKTASNGFVRKHVIAAWHDSILIAPRTSALKCPGAVKHVVARPGEGCDVGRVHHIIEGSAGHLSLLFSEQVAARVVEILRPVQASAQPLQAITS